MRRTGCRAALTRQEPLKAYQIADGLAGCMNAHLEHHFVFEAREDLGRDALMSVSCPEEQDREPGKAPRGLQTRDAISQGFSNSRLCMLVVNGLDRELGPTDEHTFARFLALSALGEGVYVPEKQDAGRARSRFLEPRLQCSFSLCVGVANDVVAVNLKECQWGFCMMPGRDIYLEQMNSESLGDPVRHRCLSNPTRTLQEDGQLQVVVHRASVERSRRQSKQFAISRVLVEQGLS